MADNWYYARGNQQFGPVAIEQLKGLLRAGQVQPGDLVWTEGMANWATANSVQELTAAPAMPAAPVTSIPRPTPPQAAYANPAPVAGQPAYYANPSPFATASPAAPVAPVATPYSPGPYAGGPVHNAPPWGNAPGGVISYAQPTFAYADFGNRLIAWIIDFIVSAVAGGIVSGVIIGVVGAAGNDPSAQGAGFVFGQLGSIVVGWLYFALMESSTTQGTLGKMALGLKVTDTEGSRVSFGKATGRHFGKYLSGLIVGIGYLMMLWNDRKQTLHDQLAGTLVMKKQ